MFNFLQRMKFVGILVSTDPTELESTILALLDYGPRQLYGVPGDVTRTIRTLAGNFLLVTFLRRFMRHHALQACIVQTASTEEHAVIVYFALIQRLIAPTFYQLFIKHLNY